MQIRYTEDQIFENVNYTKNKLIKGEYENCSFINCIFSNIDISEITFINCEFKNCDLCGVKIVNTAFREVNFYQCKMLGVNFDECNQLLLSISFTDCQLNLSSFYKLKLKNTNFKNCNLSEIDFTDTDLTNSVFDNCDLSDITFDHTVLEMADLTTSYNFNLDPENNRITRAKFSSTNVLGLLTKYNIEIE